MGASPSHHFFLNGDVSMTDRVTADETPLSLVQFAVAHEEPACRTCALPGDVRGELERARRADRKRYTYPVISAWLASRGIEVHPDALRRHFKRHITAPASTWD